MLLSKLFAPLLKENPIDAELVSHQLLLRAGFIRQITSGIYSWLPLGLMVLRNIENIIRTEMSRIGANELLMPTMQPASLWEESGRYEAYGKEMLRITDRHDRQMLYGPTNEEVVTDIFRQNVKSYKELPINLYQIQWKFRDEIRPRFGIMRAREFLMKDGYSFDLDFAGAEATYRSIYASYFRIFKKIGLNAIAMNADSGAIGGNLSHEFHIIAKSGESEVFYDPELLNLANEDNVDFAKMSKLYAAADEKHDPSHCATPVASGRGIEVGHIFYFGTKYSKAMNARITNSSGELIYPEMGSYGIGVSRLVAAAVEANHDERGIIWPDNIAPFKVMIVNLRPDDSICQAICEDLYSKFILQDVAVLYDNKPASIGEKFATADLIGVPYQIIIGPKLAVNGEAEIKLRRTGEKTVMLVGDILRAIHEK